MLHPVPVEVTTRAEVPAIMAADLPVNPNPWNVFLVFQTQLLTRRKIMGPRRQGRELLGVFLMGVEELRTI